MDRRRNGDRDRARELRELAARRRRPAAGVGLAPVRRCIRPQLTPPCTGRASRVRLGLRAGGDWVEMAGSGTPVVSIVGGAEAAAGDTVSSSRKSVGAAGCACPAGSFRGLLPSGRRPFPWVDLTRVWRSRNDRLVRWLGDPTSDRYRAWMATRSGDLVIGQYARRSSSPSWSMGDTARATQRHTWSSRRC